MAGPRLFELAKETDGGGEQKTISESLRIQLQISFGDLQFNLEFNLSWWIEGE
jgi:hypothetical protein